MDDDAQSQLVLFLAHLEAGKLALHQERRHTFISGRGIGIGEQQEEAGFGGVGDPKLAAVEQEMIAAIFGARGHGEGVGARSGFRERVGRHGVFGQPRQVFGLLPGAGPLQERVIADGVLHIDDHARRRVDGGEFFHRQDGLEETAALAAVLLRDLDAHQSHFEKLPDDVLTEDAGLVHLADVGADLLAGELAHGGLEELFVFGEHRQRERSGLDGFGDRGHIATSVLPAKKGTCGSDSGVE